MILFVGGATVDVARYSPDAVGVLVRPGQGVVDALLERREWAADNAAFTDFDAGAFVSMLERVRGVGGCRFVVAPDVVGNAEATLRAFNVWEPMIRSLGFPVALAAQDGLTAAMVPWRRIDALFLGGTTEFKMGREAEKLLGCAAAFGKWRHIGRVNSLRRMRHFVNLADSFDGSGFSRWPKRIRLAVRWLSEIDQRPRFGPVAS